MRIVGYDQAFAGDWVALYNLLRPTPITVAEFAEREARWPANDIRLRFLGRDGGRTVAIGQLSLAPFAPPDHLGLSLCVDPSHRRRGHGTQMLDHLEEEAGKRDYAALAATLPEEAAEAHGWAGRRGFRQHALRFDGLLDLTRWAPPADACADHAPAGVTLSSMAGATEAQWRSLVALFGRLLAETPDMEGLPSWSDDRCRAALRSHPGAREDWLIVARSNDIDIGLTVGQAMGHEVYSFFTGVAPGWRGQGLGIALKRRLIEVTRGQGIAAMRTTNLDRNRPALRMNEKLGFRRAMGSVELRKRLVG
ncbi:GNAT family N-acetyltransferase [Nostoc sp. NIES-2111]